MVIEGGVNTDHPLARIISIQTEGAAFQAGGLKIGQLISYVDGCPLSGKYRICQYIHEHLPTKRKEIVLHFEHGRHYIDPFRFLRLVANRF